MRAEAQALLSDEVFRRSPVLSKLLRYLVEETVAGRAGQLKSFVVAVDGLGRSENFDAASDSSARVQMVRLRKTLENYYAKHGPVDELCIYLQPGSYSVRLGRLPTAYPMLYRPLSQSTPPPSSAPAAADTVPPTIASEAAALPPVPGEAIPLEPSAQAQPFYRRNPIVVASIVAAIIAVVVTIVMWQMLGNTRLSSLSPVLEIMPVDSGDQPELVQPARIVASTLASDLPRFKLSRVRVMTEAEALEPTADPQNTYRLFSRLEDSRENGLTLYLNLEDVRSDTSLWSREVALPSGGLALFDALVPLLGEINGPMGIIAMHGNSVHKDSNDAGYPCLLKYFEFVRTRESAIERKLADCLEKPVEEQRIEATILAARSLFAIERQSARTNFTAATNEAIMHARAAVAADPNDGSANFALARMSYLAGDCVSARFYSDRTLETNPYSPMFMATLAGLGNLCNYPKSNQLLDQAILTQTPQFAKGRLLLVLGALGQGRPERISEVGASDLPSSRYNRINYYLAETLIAASQGRRADAARNWRLYSDALPPGSQNADEKLRDIVAIPVMRRKLIAYLTQAGVIGPSG